MTKRFFPSRSWRAPALCAMLLCGSAVCESLAQPTGVARGYLSQNTGQNGALIQAGGEFRVVAANLLWAKVVDHYHHQYLAEGGDWARNVSLLPLLHTIVQLDPHFTEAYEIMGGTILPRTGREAEGKAVLEEGIRNNPDDWEMYREMALLCARTDRHAAQALPYAQRGLLAASQVTDDDGFSRRLMARLCSTLHRELHGEKPAGS